MQPVAVETPSRPTLSLAPQSKNYSNLMSGGGYSSSPNVPAAPAAQYMRFHPEFEAGLLGRLSSMAAAQEKCAQSMEKGTQAMIKALSILVQQANSKTSDRLKAFVDTATGKSQENLAATMVRFKSNF